MTPYLSVIIPTLNEDQYLPRLLKNLQKQKIRNFEVIVVDSNSEDKTKEKAMVFKHLIPLTFFENEYRNVSFQRNFGAQHAKGSYLVFLDADSQINPSFTGRLEKNIRLKKGLFFLPKLKTDSRDPDIKIAVDVINVTFEASQVINRPFALGGAMILEKSYFLTIGGFDPKLKFGEDTDLARRSLEWNVKMRFIPDVSVTYSMRRIQREGRLKSIYKYFVGTVNYLMHGITGKKLFEYEMGGHLYKDMKKSRQPFNRYLEDLFKRAKVSVTKLIEE